MQDMEVLHIYVFLHVLTYLADLTRYFCRIRVYLSSVLRENGRTVKFILYIEII